jgi:hypothetical protein
MRKLISIVVMILMSVSNGRAEVFKTPQRVRKEDSIRAHRPIGIDAGKADAVRAKRDRELKHPKLIQRLESRLIDAVEQAALKGGKQSVAELKALGVRTEGEDVIVIVECSEMADPEAVAALIVAKKGTVIRTGETHVKAAVPVAALEDIASIPGVSFVRTPVKKRLDSTVVSEGRGVAGVNPWHVAGYTGQGVKIAVIDSGFAGLAALKAQGEIPASAIEVDFSGTGMTSGPSGHGCACAEITD